MSDPEADVARRFHAPFPRSELFLLPTAAEQIASVHLT
jgi:hypothetical protein